MKKLLLTVSALVALSLLAPSTGFAYHNQLGFYTAADNMIPQVTDPGATPFFVYVVLHEPYNPEFSVDVQNISAFEFQLTIPAGTFILGQTWPVVATNFGNDENEYIVGYGEPGPVSADGPTLIMTLNLMVTGTGPDQFILVSPTDTASIVGAIAFVDEDNSTIIAMYPSTGGDMADPIFAINPVVDLVAIDEISFDAVKALYR